MKYLILAIFTSLFSVALAIDFEDAVFPEIATSSRALAIGNAYVAGTKDGAAAFYNPAGLGSVRGAHFRLSNFHIESNKGWINSSGGGKAVDIPKNIMNGLSLDGARELLLENKGTISHLRLQALPNFTTRYFTAGYLLSIRQRGTIGKEASAKYEYAFRRDHGPYMGLNVSMWGGIMKFGASVIYLSRKEAIGEGDQNTKIDFGDNDFNKGRGVIVTGGAKLTLPIAALPTFAITSHNLAQSKFTSIRGAGSPKNMKNTVDLGFSLTPKIGKVLRFHFEVNYKDSTNRYKDVGSSRKILAGFEIDFARFFFIRAGYGDGFGSGGIGIKGQALSLDLTTYAVDTTANEFRGREDRRFALGFSSGF